MEPGEERPEGFLARHRRQLVHARFRGGEQVVLGDPQGAETLADYLRAGPTSRFFSRLFGLVIAATCGATAVAGAATLITGGATGWYVPGIAVLTLGCAYISVRHLAGWRCMRRHRRATRRTR